jgi:hypothetical protein
MRRTLILILGVALFGILTAVVVASQGADDPVGTGTTTTNERTTTTEDNPDRVRTNDDNAAGDISGPCDEAEHANDPRCNGQAPAAGDDRAPAQGGGVDISGPCDEAEHANDPRCTGAATGGGTTTTDDHGGGDNSGPGSSNSGPGSSNSGPGSANSGRDDDRGEPEVGDDRGGHGEIEAGDDHGGGGSGGGNSGRG